MRYSTYKSIHQPEQALTVKPDVLYGKPQSHNLRSLPNQIKQRAMIKLIITISVFIAGCSVVFTASAGDQPVLLNKKIVVSSGDTLWSISLANKPQRDGYPDLCRSAQRYKLTRSWKHSDRPGTGFAAISSLIITHFTTSDSDILLCKPIQFHLKKRDSLISLLLIYILWSFTRDDMV